MSHCKLKLYISVHLRILDTRQDHLHVHVYQVSTLTYITFVYDLISV